MKSKKVDGPLPIVTTVNKIALTPYEIFGKRIHFFIIFNFSKRSLLSNISKPERAKRRFCREAATELRDRTACRAEPCHRTVCALSRRPSPPRRRR